MRRDVARRRPTPVPAPRVRAARRPPRPSLGALPLVSGRRPRTAETPRSQLAPQVGERRPEGRRDALGSLCQPTPLDRDRTDVKPEHSVVHVPVRRLLELEHDSERLACEPLGNAGAPRDGSCAARK